MTKKVNRCGKCGKFLSVTITSCPATGKTIINTKYHKCGHFRSHGKFSSPSRQFSMYMGRRAHDEFQKILKEEIDRQYGTEPGLAKG